MSIKSKFWRIALVVFIGSLMVFGTISTGLANEWSGFNSKEWQYPQGLDSEDCSKVGEGEEGQRPPEGWIHWLAPRSSATEAILVLGGSGEGEYEPTKLSPVVEFYTPYFDLEELEAIMYYKGTVNGDLIISDYCSGREESLLVEKTVDTEYIRTHFWDIDKWVETDNGDELEDGTPKIWLDEYDNEEESATWYVDVTYEGYEDSGFNVSGTVTITNDGDLDAMINSVEDLLGGTAIDVDFEVTFPYLLPVGQSIVGTYDVDGYLEGDNVVTVTTAREKTYSATEAIVWGDPDEEINETVNIKDFSKLFGDVNLGSVTAPNGDRFDYDKEFAYGDYSPGSYVFENTASIVETGQIAEAILKVNVREESLLVEKTVDTEYIRTHFWDIDKWVETENGDELDDGTPKIWLYTDGSGDETATWYVDVTYEGYEDSGYNVSGTVTITNDGDLDAMINSVDDLLGGTAIDVDFEVTFPYLLPVGESIVGTYDEDGYFEGDNVVTVTTAREKTYSATEAIIWGDPDEEINETVNIKDFSDLFGDVNLGSVTAPNGDRFDYDKEFAYEDYPPGSYAFENTASIVETGQYAEAVLKVNVQKFIYESAWAKGDDGEVTAYAFCDYGFNNWGWSNLIKPGYEGSWTLWAGAAQCDTSKGTDVGEVSISYEDGSLHYEFVMNKGYSLDKYDIYAGSKMFPTLRNGRSTVAPGQYSIAKNLSGDIYVIVHGVIGLPDPDFGPKE